MRTSKPISSISYNTVEFLTYKLNELVNSKKIEFWAFIVHKPEDDEGGKKPHIHLYVQTSYLVQTIEFGNLFVEYSVDGVAPLRCLPFQVSKFGDWFLYALHDKSYIASKGQSRKYQYSIDDFHCSDIDTFRYNIKCIDVMKYKPLEIMEDYINKGLSFADFFKSGIVPVQQIGNYQLAFELIKQNKTFRNGRDKHE